MANVYIHLSIIAILLLVLMIGPTFNARAVGLLYFQNERFSINFPNDWNILEIFPNSVRFVARDGMSRVTINWGSPAPSWILDKSAWISNMTKQGIIVDKIDNTTTIANNTGLLISFIDNDMKYSVALIKIHNLVLDLVYFTHTPYFPTYEDEANTMLKNLRVFGGEPSWQDSRCNNTLFIGFHWWPGQNGRC